MMRRRSSSRCSRKLMPVISSEPRSWAFSITGLGIVARGVRSSPAVSATGCRSAVSEQPGLDRRRLGSRKVEVPRGIDSMGGTLTVSKSFSAGRICGLGLVAAVLARSSSSMFIISTSSWFLNSLLAFLNSASALPNWRPNSGSFLGPKMTRANKKMKIISGMPRFICSS